MSTFYIDNDTAFKESSITEELKHCNIYFVDTETSGLNARHSKLCLLQIKAGKNVFVVNVLNISVDNFDKILGIINTVEKTWVLHNAKFDLKFFYAKGINVWASIEDTQLMQSCLLQGRSKDKLSLKYLADEYCNVELDKEEQTSDWTGKLSDSQIKYAAMDVIILEDVYNKLKALVKANNLEEVVAIENAAVKATARLEFTGVCIDVDAIRSFKRTLKKHLDEMKKPFRTHNVNVNSPTQLKRYLLNNNIPVSKTSKDELAKHIDNPIVAKVMEIKKEESLLKGINTLLEGRDRTTKRVHCKYNQNMTSTGRYSTSSPNIQGLPHAESVRSLIISPENKKLIISDYSQIELRIIAEVAEDEEMMNAYISGKDLHRITAATVNQIAYEEVSSEQRKAAKAMNFGLIYGMGAKSFIKYAKTNYGVDIDEDDAIEMIDKFFCLYPKICERIFVMEDKETNFESTRSGRTRVWQDSFPSMNVRCNYEIQGLGADIIKVALARVEKELVCTGEAELMISVHDEIVIAADEDKAEAVADKLKTIMEESAAIYIKKVPIIAEVSIGDNWAAK